jgi:hypothetical protein
MNTTPDARTAQVSAYADAIMTEIHHDMETGFPWGKHLPRDVGSFSHLHDYCDANEYLLNAVPEPAQGCDCPFDYPAVPEHTAECAVNTRAYAAAQDAHHDLMNAVADEVDRRLAAEALALGTGDTCKCGRLVRFNGGHGHGHWIHLDDGSHQCAPCQFCRTHMADGEYPLCGTARVTIGDDPSWTFLAAEVDAETWNGWACPWFTEDVARKIAAVTRAEHDRAPDVMQEVIEIREDTGPAERFWLTAPGEDQEPYPVGARQAGGRWLYAVGAGNWTWEVTAPAAAEGGLVTTTIAAAEVTCLGCKARMRLGTATFAPGGQFTALDLISEDDAVRAAAAAALNNTLTGALTGALREFSVDEIIAALVAAGRYEQVEEQMRYLADADYVGEDEARALQAARLGQQAPLIAEKINREGDWLICLCGNRPDMGGFASCLADGTEIEPEGGPGGWDGKLYVCLNCGRIINQDTLEVTGRRPGPESLYDAAFAAWKAHGRHPAGSPYDVPPAQPGCPGCDAYLAASLRFTEALRERDAADDSDGVPVNSRLEAICTECGQAFMPNDAGDLIHILTTAPEGVKWGDPSTYGGGVRLGELSADGIASLADALAGADTTAQARRVVADYSGDMPEGPERYCGGRGEWS